MMHSDESSNDNIFTIEEILRKIIKEEVSKNYLRLMNFLDKSDQLRDNVMNLNEFCSYVGCSKSHAYRLTSKRKIPFSRKNGKLWFLRSKVDEWLMSNPVKTQSEIDLEVDNFLSSKC